MGTGMMAALIVVGLLAGILSGFVGIGGGVVIVPALVGLLRMSQHQAQGNSLAMLLLPVGILAVWNYQKQGFVDYKIVLLMAIGFIVGGFIGSKISLSLSAQTVKRVFGCVMLLVAIKMIFSK